MSQVYTCPICKMQFQYVFVSRDRYYTTYAGCYRAGERCPVCSFHLPNIPLLIPGRLYKSITGRSQGTEYFNVYKLHQVAGNQVLIQRVGSNARPIIPDEPLHWWRDSLTNNMILLEETDR